jgi:uncharacterized membrane protein YfcA
MEIAGLYYLFISWYSRQANAPNSKGGKIMTFTGTIIAGLAALAAGFINALAGGGTLITFPVLMAIGIPAISANITNTVALCPGYLGGTLSQSKDMKGQRKRLFIALPAAILGGFTGGILLLYTGEKLFTNLVPFLIILASILLAVQNPIRVWLARRQQQGFEKNPSELWAFIPVFLGAIYGGYFGAGLSVIMLAVLGLIMNDNLTRLNAIKQGIAFATNLAAAFFFVFSGKVVWSLAMVMAAGALLGGVLGGRLASKVNPITLRWLVVSIGLFIGIIYLIKTYFLV